MIIQEYREVTNKTDDTTPMESSESPVIQYLSRFDDYHLDEQSSSVLKSFLCYLTKKGSIEEKISYNFIIHCSDTARALSFVNELSICCNQITQSDKKPVIMSESHFLEKPKDAFTAMEFSGLFALHSCLPLEDYAPESGSGKTDELKRNRAIAWIKYLSQCEKTPQSHKIIIAPEYVLRERFRNNEHLYFRVFRNHIYIDDMTIDEVYTLTINKLNNKRIRISEAVFDSLADYIQVVYPKADLRNELFVDDLIERIFTKFYSEANDNNELLQKHIPYCKKTKNYDEILQDMNDLVGMGDVKKALAEIPYILQESPKGSSPSLHMAFVGNAGTGKTTVAKLAADLLYSMGVIRKNKVVSVNALDLLASYVGQTSRVTKSYCRQADGGILFIDEAYLLASNSLNTHANDEFRQEAVGTLIQEMENNRDRLLVIFAGYPAQMKEFLDKSNPGLKSRLYRIIEFRDYSNDELVEIFVRLCNDEGYSITPEALEKVALKLSAIRYNKGFGNARAVRIAYQEAKKECRARVGNDKTFIAEDIVLETKFRDFATVKKEFDKLIGLESAKEELNKMIETCRFSKETGVSIPFSKHMLFLGNAGTGKSTVAKLFCEMLFSIGATKSPNCVTIVASDLTGFGGSADTMSPTERLREHCRRASGGVLFIDEAYLMQDWPNIITALITVMEEERENIIIILAGYKTEMIGFLKENQGLKSRFPVTVLFDDYSDEQLAEIFIHFCNQYHFTISTDGLEELKKAILLKKKEKDFGNARAMRNLFEQSFRQHAVNYRSNPEHCERMVLDREDIIVQIVPEKRMGFEM